MGKKIDYPHQLFELNESKQKKAAEKFLKTKVEKGEYWTAQYVAKNFFNRSINLDELKKMYEVHKNDDVSDPLSIIKLHLNDLLKTQGL